MLQREMEVEAKRLNIKITISQETEPLGTGLFHYTFSVNKSLSIL